MTDLLVDMAGVRLAYVDALAVDGLDMQVPRGAFHAVVGPSGCGKSSLMKLVTGLMPPTAGEIRVDGALVRGPLKIVGMAFQNPTLLPWRSALGNIMLPLEIVQPYRGRMARERAQFQDQARALLAVGLQGFEGRNPWQLSGGMQQRASLCRALIHQPELLMLDEPCAALDAFTREELWDVLQAIWLQRGFTTILVTHDLREAVYLADTVHIMSSRPGRIVASHTIDLPRPRNEQTAFDPVFIDLVHLLRDEVRGQRSRVPAVPGKRL